MKKYISILMVILIIPTFFGCSNPIKQYETNEKSNYLTNETFKGGKKHSKYIYTKNMD